VCERERKIERGVKSKMPKRSLLARLAAHNGESNYWVPSPKSLKKKKKRTPSSRQSVSTGKKPPKKRLKHSVSKKRIIATKSPTKGKTSTEKKSPIKKKTPIKKKRKKQKKKEPFACVVARIGTHNQESSYWHISGPRKRKRTNKAM